MTEWTKKYPNEEGTFWFYGYRYGRISVGQKCKPEYCLIKVRKISNGFMHTADGSFVFENEMEEAWFKKVDLPDIPKNFKE